MKPEEKRSFVRGIFSFKVKFATMTREEYIDLKKSNEVIFPPFNQEQIVGINNREIINDLHVSTSLKNYLVQMDEKLDRILEFLLRGKVAEGFNNQGVGLNISGSGMNIMVDKSVEYGRIIHAIFYLSRLPIAYMDIFGEVVHVAQVDKDGRPCYKLGIKFLDLSVNDRERIISAVFERQRGEIRKTKSEL